MSTYLSLQILEFERKFFTLWAQGVNFESQSVQLVERSVNFPCHKEKLFFQSSQLLYNFFGIWKNSAAIPWFSEKFSLRQQYLRLLKENAFGFFLKLQLIAGSKLTRKKWIAAFLLSTSNLWNLILNVLLQLILKIQKKNWGRQSLPSVRETPNIRF